MDIVSESAAEAVVGVADAIPAIREAFRELAAGHGKTFPPMLAHGAHPTGRWGGKGGFLESGPLGVKIGSYWPTNRERGLPNHGSTTLLLDPETGLARAVVAAGYLTALRTAAADAVAADLLARPEAESVGIIGAGHQAWFDLSALLQVRKVRRVRVWNREAARAEAFAERARRDLGLSAEAVSLETACDADIIVTATAARSGLVEKAWVRPGAHISAMGADQSGKQELAIALAASARLFCDDPAQSVSIGEFEAAFKQGLIDTAALTPLGAVLLGVAEGRRSPDDITIFDSSGIAIQDLAIAEIALARAKAQGLVLSIP